MPYRYSIDEDRRLVHVKMEGRLTPEGLRECTRAYLSDPRFEKDFDALFEYGDDVWTEISGEKLGPIDFAERHVNEDQPVLEEIVDSARERRGRSPRRIATAGGPQKERASFLTNMGLLYPEVDAASFDTVDEAITWLKAD